MNSKEKKPVMTEEDIMKLLDSCYEKMFKWDTES